MFGEYSESEPSAGISPDPKWRAESAQQAVGPAFGSVSPNLRNRKALADSAGEFVGNFGVSGNCLNPTCARIAPEGVRGTITFEKAPVTTKVPEE